MRFLVVLVLLIISTQSQAFCDDRQILGGGWSHHFVANTETDEPWNEKHDVLGFQCDDISLISFTNSLGEEAYAIGYDFDLTFVPPIHDSVDVELYTALWTGYEEIEPSADGVIPVISPKVSYQFKFVETHILLNPIVAAAYIGIRF